MKFEIKERTTLEIALFGTEFRITKPSAVELQTVQDRIGDAPSSEALGLWIKWFEDLGIARESLEKLELSQLLDLVSFVTGSKKN